MPMKNSVHKKQKNIIQLNIATNYALFCLCVLLAASVLMSRLISRNSTNQINTILSLVSDKVNTSFSMMADYTTQAADIFSAMNDKPFEEAYNELQKTLGDMPYSNIGIIMNDGTIYGTDGEKSDMTKHGFMENAISSDSLYITEPYRSGVTGDNMITIFAPIYRNNERCGSIYTTYYLKAVQELASTVSLSEGTDIFLLNPYSANYVYCSGSEGNPPGTWNNLRLIKNDISSYGDTDLDTWIENVKNYSTDNIVNYKINGNKYALAYVNIEDMKPWNIVIRMPASALSGTMQRFILDIVICASLLIIATFIFAGSAYLSEHNRSIKLQALSSTDPLTKVINRRALNTKMDSFISENPNPLRCSYIFLDIDFFKEVNDTYGHDMGDKVLCMAAAILKDEFEDVGIVSRVGGDEFNVFVYEPISKEKLNKLMERIKLEFENIHRELQQTMPIHFSAGIAAFPDNAENINDLAALADKALYHTKQNGRNGYCWYNDINDKTK